MSKRARKPRAPDLYETSTADVRPKPAASFETYTTSTADEKPAPPKVPGPRCYSES